MSNYIKSESCGGAEYRENCSRRENKKIYLQVEKKNHGDRKGMICAIQNATEMGRNIRMKICEVQTSG